MADLKHVTWLLEGVDSWNSRRKENDFAPNLSRIDLKGEYLKAGRNNQLDQNGNVFLQGINLSGANLFQADLRLARLRDSDLTGANLTLADLTGTFLDGADLRCANLTAAKIEGADLFDAKLIGADMTRTEPWTAHLFENPSEMTRFPTPELYREIRSIEDLLSARRELKEYYSRDNRRPITARQHREIIEAPFIPDTRLYFRGVSRFWPLRPSVMRLSNGGESGERYAEAELLVDLMSRRPGEFSGEDSAFAQLVLARHYGLKTRLLDISRNPLISLYHACNDDAAYSGRLHIFAVPRSMIKPFTSDTISIIANFAKLTNTEQDLILGRKWESDSGSGEPTGDLEYKSVMRRLYHFIMQEKPYFEERIKLEDLFRVFVVEPRQSFDRIRAQAGAFLISAFHSRFERHRIRCWNKQIPVYDHYYLNIPYDAKEKFLDELSFFNITHETVYPGLEESASAVNALADETIMRG